MSALDVDSARRTSCLYFTFICVLTYASLSSRGMAQCTDPVPTEPVEEQVENTIFGSLGCVAMHEEGDFIIAWRQRIDGFRSTIRVQRFCRDGSLLESYATLSGPNDSTWMPSIAASRSGHYHAAWLGGRPRFSDLEFPPGCC